MKNNIRNLVLACALFLGGHSAFAQSNQAVDVFNQTICRGVSVNLNGTLYKLKGGYKITSITAENQPGVELMSMERVTPQQTTVYTIKTATTAGVAQPDAKVTVTVHNRPTLSIEFVNENSAVSDGMVCEGTTLQFRVKTSGNLNGNPVIWYVSSSDQPTTGNTFSFTAQNTCEVTALANNGYCPIADTTIRVRVFTPPTPENVDVVWNTEWKGDFCQGCGFFPNLQDILKSGGDEVVYANSTIEWADGGGTNERTLALGGNTFRFRIHYEVRRKNRCGDVTMQMDTVVTLRLASVKDCKVEASAPAVTVRPCEPGSISLLNRYPGSLQLNGNGAVEPTMADQTSNPVAGEWLLTRSGPISQSGNELYNWEVLLQKYSGPKTWAGFRISGTAKMSCPYSKTEPVKTVNYSVTVPVRLDTTYMTTKFEYCPNQPGTLEVSFPQQINGVSPAIQLNILNFPKPDGVLAHLRSDLDASTASKFVYNTDVAITSSNVASFLPLTVKAIYDVKVVKGNLNCQFRQTEERVVESTPRSDCDISFTLPNTATCIGEGKTLTIAGGSGGNNITVSNITIDDNGSLAIKADAFQTTANGGQLVFYPYYAGAPGVDSKTDTITATATYKMNGSAQELRWTKKFEVKVKACVPELSAYGFDCASCLRCPGTEGRLTIEFKNPTTDKAISRVDWCPEPATKPTVSPWSGLLYRMTARYYTDTKLDHIPVVYNEGDSTYSLKLVQLNNKAAIPFQNFTVDPNCAMRVVPDQESCCMGDEIEADIINGNSKTVGKTTYYSQFQQLIWDPSVIQYVAEESRSLTTEQNLQGGNKGYRVKVLAYEEGIYPFRVVAKVGDTTITYADTLKLNVLGRPRAFLRDTVYACLGENVDLTQWVDKAAVKKIGTSVPADLQHYVPNTEDPQTVYAYKIEMLTQCLSLGASNMLEKDSMVVIAGPSVYISMISSESYCSGEEFTLQAPTNGTTFWYKQKKYPTGGYGPRELVVGNWPGNKDLKLMMEKDSMLYTIESFTACPDNGEASVSFGVYPKAGPQISVRDTFACGSETVTLNADYDATVTGPVSWTVDGKPATQPYVQSPYPSRDYVMKVEATVTGTLTDVNDCAASDTAVIRFYASPTVAIVGKTNGVICADGGVSVRLEAQGDASNQYEWFLEDNDKRISIGTGAVVNRSFDKDTSLHVEASNSGSCKTIDHLRIVLNGKKRAVADTTVCVGSDFSFYMPEQDWVTYNWYNPDGNFRCACESIGFPEFSVADAGTYKVEIVRNNRCTVTQNIDIKAYPVPVMDFGTTENPVHFCAGNPLVLQLRPKIDGREVSGYFAWTDPVGTEVLAGDGKNTYVKDPVLMVDRGSYEVAFTYGVCTYNASVNVRVDDHTNPQFSLQPYYCEGEDAVLNTTFQGEGTTYEWFNEAGRRIGPATGLFETSLAGLTLKDAGALYLVVTKGACKDTVSQPLSVRESPTADMEVQGGSFLEGERYFCEGETAAIVLKNMQAGDSSWWVLANGETRTNVDAWRSDAVLVSDAGTYSAVLVRNGCSSEQASEYLDVRIVPVLILQDTFVCQGREVVVNVENADYPGAVYTWRELGVQAPSASLDKAGEYHIVMDLRGCTDEGSFRLMERPVPDWYFPSDTSICNRDSLLLQGPEGMDSYLWQDGSSQTWFLVNNRGLYSLAVTLAGCANEKSVYVETEFCSPIFFPSAFTPNGDGINDEFGPISLAEEGELEYAFFVYNRNGQLMFQSTDIHRSWDGTFKGQPCPAGVYTYRCKIIVTESGRDLSRIGTVHLLR